MRRLSTVLLAAALPVSLLAFAPVAEGEAEDSATITATAEEEGEESVLITPDPIDFTFHLHGDEENPYVDDEVYATSGNQVMDTQPATGDFQSRQLLNYVRGPNSACSDNALFPTWTGYVGEGTVVGEGTLRIDVVGGTGGPVDVRLWTDTGGGCNEANVAPHVVTTVNLPTGSGTLEVPLEMDGLDPLYEMKVMIVPGDAAEGVASPDAQGRLVYDGIDYDATLSFTCQPDDVETQEEAEAADCLPF